MSVVSDIQIRYAPVRAYANVQNNYIGAQAIAGRRGTLPTFTDANCIFVAKTGSNSNPGTAASPVLTITYAETLLGADVVYICVMDSGVYDEIVTITFSANSAGGLYAADGQTPTITKLRGATPGTYGARRTGRTAFYSGAHYCYVSKTGNDGTGVRDDASHPFLTIQAAVTATAASGDCVQIQDDGVYVEDVDVAAHECVIQARDGFVPVMTNGAGAKHLYASVGTVNVEVLGIFFRETIRNTGITIDGGASVELHDCSFSNGNILVNITGVSQVYTFVNCAFVSCTSYAIELTGATGNPATTLTNCYFDSCGTATQTVHLSNAGITTNTFTATRCTWHNGRGTAEVFTESYVSAFTLSDCVFENTHATPTNTVALYLSFTIAQTITNTLFSGMGGQGIHASNPIAPYGTQTYAHLVFVGCSTAGHGAMCEIDLAGDSIRMSDCVFIRSDAVAVAIGSTTTDTRLDRCAFVSSGTYAVTTAASSAVTISDCLEYGSVTGAIANGGTMTVQTSIIQKAITGSPTLGVGYLAADPLFLSVVPGDERIGLSAQSGAWFAASDFGNMGPRWPLLTVSSANHAFVVDGLTITGDKYFSDGLTVATAVVGAVAASHCSFTELMGWGMWLDATSSSTDNSLRVNGAGVVMSSGPSVASYTVADRCGSAGFIVGAFGATLSHVTAYGCEYGQYDFATGGGAAASSNVYSGNGAADYSGSGDQAYSLVGRIVGGGTATNGVQGSALFRDLRPSTLDLRLQAVEYGYAYDSPGKALSADGSDAGAYDVTYGALTLTWTTIDFATATYRQFTDYLRTFVVIKATRTDTFGGNTQISQAAVVKRHEFRWDRNADMPDAQLADLMALFSAASSETQISFDAGVTYVPTRMEKDTPPIWTELGGLWYSSAGVPTPIDQISFIESA